MLTHASHPLVITADGDSGRATMTVPHDMVIERVRAYTRDPAGLKVCRLNFRSAGTSGEAPYWSPYDQSSDVWPPLHMLVTPDERPNEPCAFTGLELKAGNKFTVDVKRLEGLADFTVELVFYARPTCKVP